MTYVRWNLDSRLPAPYSFAAAASDKADGGASQLVAFLTQQLADGAHILLVYRRQAAAASSGVEAANATAWGAV